MKREVETVVVRLTKVFYDGEPAHWECDVDDIDGEYSGGATGPTFMSVLDSAIDIIYGGVYPDSVPNEWIDFDANK